MKQNDLKLIYLFLYPLVFLFCLPGGLYGQLKYTGVNLAGAEFGDNNLPGIHNQHYTYPTPPEVDYFVEKGMNIFRLPFKWERLQQTKLGNLNQSELARIESFVNYAAAKKAYTILDPHNYARYYGDIIGSDRLPVSFFEDFWRKLSMHFKDNPFVIFGLMNEPHDMSTELWLADANAAISAIRSTGAVNLILVPGNAYTGAHSWNANWYGTPNGIAMRNIVDPGNNYAFEVHQYLDDNSSGTSASCVSSTIGSSRLKDFTGWLRKYGKRGFLGEFGISVNEDCQTALEDMLSYVDENKDVWLGWSYWAAGPWWGDYMFSIEPKDGEDRPQMSVLEKHFADTTGEQDSDHNPVRSFTLFQNYPNPFNPGTTISYRLAKPAFVMLVIYNIDGRLVASLVNAHKDQGNYSETWNAEGVSSGIYFYRIKAGAFSETKKCLIIR
jgi:endoglucanase